jgi:localization factor PodJL
MKSNAPWSVKGIERDARETAKEAARREGMTVGEWLSQVIHAASDPATSDGEIEGLKISDLVRAIEHLNKRVIHAEFKGAAAADDLARNLAIIVERVQRLERVKPGGGGPELDERLSRIEEKLTDRQRIDALKALEKAISHAVMQLDVTQKSSAARMDATEKQMQELASRFDLVVAVADGDGGPQASAGLLQEKFDDLAARIAGAERVAKEASERAPEDHASGRDADPEFVERTGARLRVLGDEIKRGGDQVRTLEGLIKRLADQIDAAERRSAEGVQKVTETISELRAQIGPMNAASGASLRQEIETAVTAATRRTDERLEALQQSFASVVARLDAADEAPAVRAEMLVDVETASVEAEAEEPPVEDELDEIGVANDDADMFDLDASEEDDLAAIKADDEEVDDFAFDLDKEESGEELAAKAAREAVAEFEREGSDSEPAQEAVPPDGLDAILAELDGFGLTPGSDDPRIDDRGESEGADSPAEELFAESAAPAAPDAPGHGDFLKEARRVAKEAAERGAADGAPTRRKLTPKQRAILAAKIKRKRLAEQAASEAQGPAGDDGVVAVKTPAPNAGEEEESASLFAKASGAIKALQARLGRRGDVDDAEGRHDEARLSDSTSTQDGNPDITKAARLAMRRLTAKPITIALGVAILLAAAALYFLVKDLMFVGKPGQLEPPRTAANAAVAQPSGPQLKEPDVAETPPAPVIEPRTLYADSVAQLKAAKTDSQLRAAVVGLEEAAALGHPPAQLQLGELYKLGQGVEQDPAQARTWYQRAANGGNVLAMHRIGVMAARGQGGPADQAAAINWFEKASNFGLVDSQYNLGAIYHPGGDSPAGGVHDAAKAYFWYALAAKNGDEQAGALASGLAASLQPARRKSIDADVAKWTAQTPDAAANEITPAS